MRRNYHGYEGEVSEASLGEENGRQPRGCILLSGFDKGIEVENWFGELKSPSRAKLGLSRADGGEAILRGFRCTARHSTDWRAACQ